MLAEYKKEIMDDFVEKLNELYNTYIAPYATKSETFVASSNIENNTNIGDAFDRTVSYPNLLESADSYAQAEMQRLVTNNEMIRPTRARIPRNVELYAKKRKLEFDAIKTKKLKENDGIKYYENEERFERLMDRLERLEEENRKLCDLIKQNETEKKERMREEMKTIAKNVVHKSFIAIKEQQKLRLKETNKVPDVVQPVVEIKKQPVAPEIKENIENIQVLQEKKQIKAPQYFKANKNVINLVEKQQPVRKEQPAVRKPSLNIDKMKPIDLYKKSIDASVVNVDSIDTDALNYEPKTAIRKFANENELDKQAVTAKFARSRNLNEFVKTQDPTKIRRHFGNQSGINVKGLFRNKIADISNNSPNRFVRK
ncbi:hypothetical protein ECANGB1_1985 [Enterospora canceri]|uniref:Uncharacterized protein n=1 Tax=Enterospora canceri TaxID=1081671 RepID=A0A1Y1S5Z0_9MICR|nr:hypothetical protein ECANGB1_1985 [Enterospora canceri]